jgi:catechol 2,3-dioxygenase-like lactoylglutathione lyase family enzyme
VTRTLTHIALHVRDVAACVAFYRDVCALEAVHERPGRSGKPIVWLAEPGRAGEFVMVLLPGGPGRDQDGGDFSHLGFAVPSRTAVDEIAEKAREEGCLIWEPRDDGYPAGYYCGVRDPDGNAVEFSYGQPLGPGATDLM